MTDITDDDDEVIDDENEDSRSITLVNTAKLLSNPVAVASVFRKNSINNDEAIDENVQTEIDREIEKVKEIEMEMQKKKDENKDIFDIAEDEYEEKYDSKGFVWLNDPKRDWATYPSFSELLVHIQKAGSIFGKTDRARHYETEFVRYRLQVEWNRYFLNHELKEKQLQANQCSIRFEDVMVKMMGQQRFADNLFFRGVTVDSMMSGLARDGMISKEPEALKPVFKHLINNETEEKYNESISMGVDFSLKMADEMQQACTIM
jgi:hypothetical protein